MKGKFRNIVKNDLKITNLRAAGLEPLSLIANEIGKEMLKTWMLRAFLSTVLVAGGAMATQYFPEEKAAFCEADEIEGKV